ncbi:ABC transporter substrate-binding protein [Thaumasiovibrio subtropicus]|uniref:ABC transporter substrate-binding protein n=1 Tax=Thaumasiovibrio subtropicus TaxID=1891207 RepID=UPI000B34D7E2|nr:ABC transporter substrate-binding protein [Thaumasiovibrio subtropicus]
MRTSRLFALLLLSLGMLSGCFSSPHYKLGFIACLSGSSVELSEATRNGAIIAVEDANQAYDGKASFELVIRNCPPDVEGADRVFAEMTSLGIKWVIGPMLSSQVKDWKASADQYGLTLISPTATSTIFTGIDDNFWRTTADNKAYARAVVNYLLQDEALKTVVVFYTTANAAYGQDWTSVFEEELKGTGVSLVQGPFSESDTEHYRAFFHEVTEGLSAGAFVVVAESVQTAKFAQLVYENFPSAMLVGTDASATTALLELGGLAIEGMIHPQPYNFQSEHPSYQDFAKRYTARFEWQVDFPSLSAYEATRFVTDSLAEFETITLPRRVDGLQGEMEVDDFGDVKRAIVLTVIEKGEFKPLMLSP